MSILLSLVPSPDTIPFAGLGAFVILGLGPLRTRAGWREYRESVRKRIHSKTQNARN